MRVNAAKPMRHKLGAHTAGAVVRLVSIVWKALRVKGAVADHYD